jgi:hypothetical protein
MDHRERANIGKISTYIILIESPKRERPLQIAGLILKWTLKKWNGARFTVKNIVSCNVVACNLEEMYQCFRGMCSKFF